MDDIRWAIEINSDMCPYRKLGGLNNASADSYFFTACKLRIGIGNNHCNVDNCPMRLK